MISAQPHGTSPWIRVAFGVNKVVETQFDIDDGIQALERQA